VQTSPISSPPHTENSQICIPLRTNSLSIHSMFSVFPKPDYIQKVTKECALNKAQGGFCS